MLTPAEYVETRLDDQIDWYDSKSSRCQARYKQLATVKIVCAAVIPFVSGSIGGAGDPLKSVVGILGVVVAVSAGLTTLNNYQERWVKYRTTCEMLRHEKFLYLSGCPPYGRGDAYSTLVRRVESLISRENTEWASMASAHEEVEAKEEISEPGGTG